jgi:hypothetical protein
MNNISFFQYFHNGDLFSSKEYVRQIVQEMDNTNFQYYHFNHEKVLRDLKIPLAGDPSFLGKNGKTLPVVFQRNNTLYINTWIEAFNRNNINVGIEKVHGINHYRLRAYWQYIFNILNTNYKTNLKLKPIDEYVADIDFTFFDTDKIKINHNLKNILVANGEVKSRQSYDGNMNNVVVELSTIFPNHIFFCTSKFITDRPNILFTDDVIADNTRQLSTVSWSRPTCDLNEISYVSQQCNLIIGRNSGPFIFCLTKNNVFDSSKTFISFNKFQDDSLLRDVNHKCQYIWSNEYDEENMIALIKSYIN